MAVLAVEWVVVVDVAVQDSAARFVPPVEQETVVELVFVDVLVAQSVELAAQNIVEHYHMPFGVVQAVEVVVAGAVIVVEAGQVGGETADHTAVASMPVELTELVVQLAADWQD